MAFVAIHGLLPVLHQLLPVTLAESEPIVLHGLGKKGLGRSLPGGQLSFARHILWMFLMEMFSRATGLSVQSGWGSSAGATHGPEGGVHDLQIFFASPSSVA
jgi:hypothetical protein